MDTDEKEKFRCWAQKIKASDEGAFSALFHEVYPRLVKYAWRYVQQKPAAHDIVQEVFIKLWNVRTTIEPKQALLSFLYKMVRNHSLNYLRDHAHSNISLDDTSPGLLQAEEEAATEQNEPQELATKMLIWINALPKRQREAIKLSRFEGLDHEEIAYVMQISPRTVNNHIVEALKTLKTKCQAYNLEYTQKYPL